MAFYGAQGKWREAGSGGNRELELLSLFQLLSWWQLQLRPSFNLIVSPPLIWTALGYDCFKQQLWHRTFHKPF